MNVDLIYGFMNVAASFAKNAIHRKLSLVRLKACCRKLFDSERPKEGHLLQENTSLKIGLLEMHITF